MKQSLLISALLLGLTSLAGAATPPPQPAAPVTVPGYTDAATGMEFVFIKGGCFKMGSKDGEDADHQPVHEVCLSDYYLGKYEVTQGQWQSIMGSNPSQNKKCGDKCPVDKVSWNDIQQFLVKLNAKSGKIYRLPTEAEWEYAASRSINDIPAELPGAKVEEWMDDYGWFKANSEGVTHPVGQKKPSFLGLYDMGGNVYEWCQDRYSEAYYQESPKNDPQGPNEGTMRVQRGGARNSSLFDLKTFARGRNESDARTASAGFRVAIPASQK